MRTRGAGPRHGRRPARAVASVAMVLWSAVAAACGSSPETDSAAGEAVAGTASVSPETAAPAAPYPADTVPIGLAELVDPAIPPAVAGEDGWGYHQSAGADLDGDGVTERVILTARVEMIRGRPAWDDGQPWQVYVEEEDGTRTYLFAQRLQLGTLTMRVALGERGGTPSIVLLEHLPDRLRLLEVFYDGPADVRVIPVFSRRLDPNGDLASPSLP